MTIGGRHADPGEITEQSDWTSRWLPGLGWGFVGLGILLRLTAFSLDFPLWWDEAFVAVNLLKRDYLGLLKPLDYGQVCPLFFLWAELLAVRVLGFHEWSLRLFPLLCAIGGMILFRLVARRLLDGRAFVLAVAIFAVSVHPIRHAADLKPYATDLLVALIVQGLALQWWRDPTQSRWLWGLAAFGPVALLSSHPSIFVVGGVGLVLAWPVWESRRWPVRIAWMAYGLTSATAYATAYVMFVRPQASAAAPGMSEMWLRSFPPRESLVGFLQWLAVAHSGDMLAYPCGGERGASSLSLLVCLVGAGFLARQRRWTILGILIAPLGLGIVAAWLRLYPYGGPAPHGSSARIMQYTAPALCLLIGLGGSRLLDLSSKVLATDRLFRWICVILVVVGVVPLVGAARQPYRAYQAEASRRFARQFWTEIEQEAEVACLRWDLGVADWDSIHLGIAVSLCNEAISSPKRQNHGGGPRLDAVSATHPLRCVLGVAPDQDTPRLVAWLDRMRRDYDLRDRRTIQVRISEPGRRAEFERYEVFEFVPRPMVGALERSSIQSVSGL